MSDELPQNDPIVRLTSWSAATSISGRGKHEVASTQWTIFGVGAKGNERVYVELPSQEEYDAWAASDPLWEEAQHAMFERLLNHPATRDIVLKLNIKAALDNDDPETAMKLAQSLSPKALQEIIGGSD